MHWSTKRKLRKPLVLYIHRWYPSAVQRAYGRKRKGQNKGLPCMYNVFLFFPYSLYSPPIFLSDGYPRVTDGYDHRYGRKFKGLFQPVFHLCIMKRASLGSPFLRRTFRTQRSSEGHHFFCRIFFLDVSNCIPPGAPQLQRARRKTIQH